MIFLILTEHKQKGQNITTVESGGRVANALGFNARGSCPSLGDMYGIYFLELIVSGTEGRNMICVTLQNLL